ncbi:MAG: FGGY family carbohydrate kinase [Treponema sp.]|nr:FGGY family carbohydrate kinase [Treponema sp.]MCL2250920.1 FGGY family carbohydrate kinase [Treponema sp.]
MLLTVDIGTTNFKTALWDFDGNRLAFVSRTLSVSDNFEINPSVWLIAFDECCNELRGLLETHTLKAGNLKDVKAIVISGNGPTLVPVFNEYHENNFLNYFSLCDSKARLWLDRRAVKYQDEISEVMGGYVDASFFLPKIFYIKHEENKLYNKTKFFLGCPEYLGFVLTGKAYNVFPSAGFDRWFWNESVLDKLNLSTSKFPLFIKPGDQFGMLLPFAAQKFGLTQEIPVISGGPDFYASLLGSGVTEQGQVCDRTGSSDGVNLCTLDKIKDKNLMSYGHPVKPFWNLSGFINTTGKAIDWACDLLGVKKFDDFIALAKNSKSGSGGVLFLPYLAGERTLHGETSAVWSALTLGKGRSEIANSVLEGIGFAIKDVLSVMEKAFSKEHKHNMQTEFTVTNMRVTGGLAACPYLNQIKADITGLEILEGVHKEAELLGLAIIGSCSLGKFNSYPEASSAFYRIEKRYEPNPDNKKLYDDMFSEYLSLKRG